ncbi:hypothetical protein A2U01_0112373, partial [Trifolium medium]|nr:hypothetical protein [Trifolium medium]
APTGFQNYCSGGEHALEEKPHTLSFEVQNSSSMP